MTDPAAYAAAQQAALQQQQHAALYAQYYQAQLLAQQQAAAAAAPRAAIAKPASRKSQPIPSRQSRRREYESDDEDDDEFEDYSHLLTPAERERRKKKLVGTGDRESDEDFHTPPGSSSSSSEEEESSSEEEDEDDDDSPVTTSEEEDFGYGPPKKDAQSRKRRDSDDDGGSGSDDDRRKKQASKKQHADAAKALTKYMRTVEVPLRRQLLRFFQAVAASNQHKQETAKAAAAGAAAPAATLPPLPAISLSLAEWEKPEQQRMAFCELLNLCPVEAKAEQREPYHYPRPTCSQGINFYCSFQPDRPQPARGPVAPDDNWVKRFEDRVKQWFALEPIGQYMQTLPPVTAEEKASDAVYTNTVNAVGQIGNGDVYALLAQAAAGSGSATAAAPASASGSATEGVDEKKAEKKKKKKAKKGGDDDSADEAGGDDDAPGKKRKGKKGGDDDGGSRKKQKKSAAAADGDSDADDSKDKKSATAPADPAAARTLFLQQLDISVRRNVLQLVASSMPGRLVDGHRENFSKLFGKELIALTFVRICELTNLTPKPFDAKTVEAQVTAYFTFKVSTPLDKLQTPSPTFVYAFQQAVRDWLRTAPVVALMGSEYWIPAQPEQTAEDAEFAKAQAEARALPAIEYVYALPGAAPVAKSGGNA